MYSAAILSRVKCDAKHCWAIFPKWGNWLRDLHISSIAAAKAAGFEGGTEMVARDNCATSLIPPTSVTTAGTPAPKASKRDTGMPSVIEDSTNKSAAARKGE